MAPVQTGEPTPLRMLMFGKPGAGKGTLTSRVMSGYEIQQLSAGDILRAHIVEGTEIGRAAEAIVTSGGLIPDDIMTKLITSKLDNLRTKNWILDGFPRTVGQGRRLDDHLTSASKPITLIVNIDVPDDVILERISDRLVHLPSGRVYNSSYNKPKVAGIDDVTGEPLVRRPDDNPAIFSRRLKAFYESTAPLLAYYSSQVGRNTAKVVTLTGNTSDEIWPQLEEIIRNDYKVKSRTLRASVITAAASVNAEAPSAVLSK